METKTWTIEDEKVTLQDAKDYLHKRPTYQSEEGILFITIIDEKGNLLELTKADIDTIEEKDVGGWTLIQDEQGFFTKKSLVLTDGEVRYKS